MKEKLEKKFINNQKQFVCKFHFENFMQLLNKKPLINNHGP